MAAQTPESGTITSTVWGDKVIFHMTFASVADGDTFDASTYLGIVESASLVSDESIASSCVQASAGATTLTFEVASGTPDLYVTFWGS
jgi:hypothetical protein